MIYISALLFLIFAPLKGFGQTSPLDGFMEGKSVVLISAAPGAEPVISWKTLAEEVHDALIEAGGDPVAYYELEDVILSDETQAGYAAAFAQRLIKNMIILTRKPDAGLVLHIMPFTGDKNIAAPGSSWSTSADSLDELTEKIIAMGSARESHNFLVIDVPEFGPSAVKATTGASVYLPRNPLNLEVFKLGVPLSGAIGESGYLTTFRYDLIGKSNEQILAEQQTEKNELEGIFNTFYPYEVEFLSAPKTDDQLISEKVQFVLMRLEGREGDLMESMGIEIPNALDKERIVVKYYIRFLVRDELYIGPVWDADPNWKTALIGFLKHLKI